MTITVTCPSCATTFPVDPRKIPEGGVNARCSACRDVFTVTRPDAHTGTTGAEPTPDEVAPAAPVPRGETWEGEAEADAEAEGEADVDSEPAQDETGTAADDWAIGGVEEWAEDRETAAPHEEPRPGTPGEVVSEDRIAQPTSPGEGQAPEAVPAPTEPPRGFQLGRRDPDEKARRLARVLVSDMIMYNPERHARALENHTLREDFEEEITKSWDEYVEQVGQEMARDTTYFRDALNEILARGEEVFDRNP